MKLNNFIAHELRVIKTSKRYSYEINKRCVQFKPIVFAQVFKLKKITCKKK